MQAPKQYMQYLLTYRKLGCNSYVSAHALGAAHRYDNLDGFAVPNVPTRQLSNPCMS